MRWHARFQQGMTGARVLPQPETGVPGLNVWVTALRLTNMTDWNCSQSVRA